jgi:glycerol-3-phosphate dehydrogenase
MASEIVEEALKHFSDLPKVSSPKTDGQISPDGVRDSSAEFPELTRRYGAPAVTWMRERASQYFVDPPGFPFLEAQLRYAIRHEMVLKLSDFFLRRVPLVLCRQDQGEPFWDGLSRVWAEELRKSENDRHAELEELKNELRSSREFLQKFAQVDLLKKQA